MLDFQIHYINSGIQASTKDANKIKNDLAVRLEEIEVKIMLIKSLVNNNIYYKSIIDEMIVIQRELDKIANIVFEENVKECMALRIQEGKPEALDKILVSMGRLIKM